MKKFLSILLFLCLCCAVEGFSEETIEINSEVISVNPELEFFIIKGGEDQVIEIGDGVIVHRDGEKIAEAYIIEVKPTVSAAEIFGLEDGKEIQEGDSTIIVRKIEDRAPTTYITSPVTIEKGDVAIISVYRESDVVFEYAKLVLRENGFSVTSTNKATGIILATKPISLSLLKELWADAFAAIDHKLAVSLEIKGEGRSSRIQISSFKEHSQKGKHIKHPVTRNTKYYDELIVLASKIKERSEY